MKQGVIDHIGCFSFSSNTAVTILCWQASKSTPIAIARGVCPLLKGRSWLPESLGLHHVYAKVLPTKLNLI